MSCCHICLSGFSFHANVSIQKLMVIHNYAYEPLSLNCWLILGNQELEIVIIILCSHTCLHTPWVIVSDEDKILMYTSFSPLLRKKFSSFAKNELRGNGTLSLTQPRSGGAGVSFDPGSKLMNIGEFDYFFTVLNSLAVDRWIKTRQMKWMRSFVSRGTSRRT